MCSFNVRIQTQVWPGWRLLAAPCCWFLRHCELWEQLGGTERRAVCRCWILARSLSLCFSIPPPLSLSASLSLREGAKECVCEQMRTLQQVEVSWSESQRRKNDVSQTHTSVCVVMPFQDSWLSFRFFFFYPLRCSTPDLWGFFFPFSSCVVTNTKSPKQTKNGSLQNQKKTSEHLILFLCLFVYSFLHLFLLLQISFRFKTCNSCDLFGNPEKFVCICSSRKELCDSRLWESAAELAH